MANLTKEERAKREAAKEAEMKAKIEAEIEAKIRAEYEKKLKDAEAKVSKSDREETSAVAKKIQSSVRIPLDTIVPVICNTVGGAFYSSKKIMGYTVEWEDIGSVEYMELGELSSMKNTDKRFFEDNWIVFDDTEEYTASELYDFLKVSKYYKNVLTPDNIDEIFTYPKDEIVKTISTLSRGMKETIAVRAKQKLDENTLDKNIIDILESSLGIQFTI
ncbi:hypothetical protein [Bariatricus sp. SGI.019]|uniref:hypothetical protein n=1 Tax=Bariatricus sp. SGI.019 TaxID=3420548 RepID=UPI003D007DE4